MAKSKKDTEFYVKLENIQLPENAVSRIEAGIQRLVMNELVGYTPDPDAPYPPKKWPGWPPSGPIIIRPPRPWPGFLVKKLLPNEIKTLGIETEFKM
ncbi:MAG: hypothetical protein WAT19_02400 [Ferruginibacter sp.]